MTLSMLAHGGGALWQRGGASAMCLVLGGLAAAMGVVASPVPSARAASAVPAESQATAVSERSVFGLPTDAATMSQLSAGADVGTATWGIPLTTSEEAELDLVGRMTFVHELDPAVLPYVRSLPSLAGFWIDQRNNGGLVVALTAADGSIEQHIRDLMPLDSRGLEFRAASYSLSALTAASDRARDSWDQVLPATTLLTVSVDTIGNAVQLGVADADLTSSQSQIPALQSRLGVPIEVTSEQPGHDTACLTRQNCAGPMRAGDQIANGSIGNWWCTMGFHIAINVGGDRQFLTAGHCGWNDSVYWYHVAYTGKQLATWYVQNGEDVMRVGMNDAEASGIVYGEETSLMSSAAAPVLNEVICGSMGFGNIIDCGTVSSTHFSWTSEHCNCGVWGARDSGITPIDGDSGSPLFEKVQQGSDPSYIIPIGIVDHQNGGFAIVTDALAHWGASIYQ